MTPVNTTADAEISEVAAAFGLKKSDNGAETVPAQEQTQSQTTSTNSAQTTQVTDGEKVNGEVAQKRVIEFELPPVDNTKDKPAQEKPVVQDQPVFDGEKYVSETLGYSAAEIKQRLARQEELEGLIKQSQYKSAKGEVFDDLVSKGVSPEKALRYMSIDKEAMTPREKVAFAMQMEYPTLSEEKINDYIDQTYQQGKYAPDGDEAPGATRLEVDALKHDKVFDELKTKLIETGSTREEQGAAATQKALVAKEADRINKWSQPTQQIFQEFQKLEFQNEKGVKLRYTVEMSEAEKQELQTEFKQMIATTPGLLADENGIKLAKEAMQKHYIGKNINKIAFSLMEQGRSLTNEEWISIAHNPSLANTRGSHDTAPKKDKDSSIYDRILQLEGGI